MPLQLRRHVIIGGYGRTGMGLARALGGRDLPFVVVDNDPFVFERARAVGVPIIFGVLTTDDLDQAMVRSEPEGKGDNKGTEAAATAVEMVDVLRQIRQT